MTLDELKIECEGKITDYKMYLRNGDITEDEYNELIGDLQDIEKIEDRIDVTHTKIKLYDFLLYLQRISRIV